MNVIVRYREAISFYAVAAVVLTAVAIGTDGNAQDGAPPIPKPRPTSIHTPTVTASPTFKATPRASSTPTPTVTLPPSSSPPSIIIVAPTPTSTPTPTITVPPPTPPPLLVPHNKAHGLKDGCLVQKKKWLLRVPCHPKQKEETP